MVSLAPLAHRISCSLARFSDLLSNRSVLCCQECPSVMLAVASSLLFGADLFSVHNQRSLFPFVTRCPHLPPQASSALRLGPLSGATLWFCSFSVGAGCFCSVLAGLTEDIFPPRLCLCSAADLLSSTTYNLQPTFLPPTTSNSSIQILSCQVYLNPLCSGSYMSFRCWNCKARLGLLWLISIVLGAGFAYSIMVCSSCQNYSLVERPQALYHYYVEFIFHQISSLTERSFPPCSSFPERIFPPPSSFMDWVVESLVVWHFWACSSSVIEQRITICLLAFFDFFSDSSLLGWLLFGYATETTFNHSSVIPLSSSALMAEATAL